MQMSSSIYAEIKEAVEAAGGLILALRPATMTIDHLEGMRTIKPSIEYLCFAEFPDAANFMKFANFPRARFSQEIQVTYASAQPPSRKLMAVFSVRSLTPVSGSL